MTTPLHTHTDMGQSETPKHLPPSAFKSLPPPRLHTFTLCLWQPLFSGAAGVSVVIWLQFCHQQTCTPNGLWENKMLCRFASVPLCLPTSRCLLGIAYQQNIISLIFSTCFLRNILAIKIIRFNEECCVAARVPQIVGTGRVTQCLCTEGF